MKEYFGYVYIWYDKKNIKFIIGSHHGRIDDRYTTSTGGIHVRNIFKYRPQDLKFRVLEYNYIVDDFKYTQELEQKWLNMRPNIRDNPRYYNRTNFAGGGFDRDIQIRKVQNGTHHLLGGNIQSASNKKRLLNNTHNFLTKEHKTMIRERAVKSVKNGTHHFCNSNFNKKSFTLFCSDGRSWFFDSKTSAVSAGIKPGIIDKVKKFGKYELQRGSRGLIPFKSGDIIYLKTASL